MKNFQLMPAKCPGRLAIIPGLLLASTGLLVPVDAIAEERLCERESAALCTENKSKTTLQASRILLAAQPYTPANATSDAIINNNASVLLSNTENTDDVWNTFRGLIVGKDSAGALVIDGRQISSLTGSIGRGSAGIVTLTNGAIWILRGGDLVLGTNSGSGRLLVELGSQISGINELRIGEFYAGAYGSVMIDGTGSTVKTNWVVVGDQDTGKLDILNGGQLVATEHMNIGYVGKTDRNNLFGNGAVRVDGEDSLLDIAKPILLGGYGTGNNDARGVLTVSNGGTVKSGKYLWLGVGKGSTGIVNVGSEEGDVAQRAGVINVPWIYLGDTADNTSTVQLNFNHNSDDFSLAADITGRGQVNHNGPGTTLLSGNNAYTGTTSLRNGTLRAGSTDAFSRNSDFTVNETATVDLNGFSQTIRSLSLDGMLSFGQPGTDEALKRSNSILTVSGNYSSNNGLLILNTTEDAVQHKAVVNQLHVMGNTSGTTRVALQALGSQTVSNLNGARVVRVDGESGGEFVAVGRLTAGAYDYALLRGNNTDDSALIPDSNHWYLTNTWTPSEEPIRDPEEPIRDPEEPAIDPDTPVLPVQQEEPASHDSVLRPELGAYLANKSAGNTLFTTRLHDRLGESHYIDPITGESDVTSMWLRNVGGHTRFRDSSGQLKTQSNRYVLQIGGDVAQWSSDEVERWHLGVMFGYANSQSNTRSDVSHYRADGSISGYSAGLYATWYANNVEKSGGYLDSWMLYNWFDNTVRGEQLATEKYRSRGVTASLEAGYAFKLKETARLSYWLQPQVQLTWMDVSSDDHQEANGTVIRDKGKGNLQSRLGVKAYLRGYNQRDEGKERLFQPFIETNWLHNSRNYSISMNEIQGDVDGAKNIAELRAGVEAKVNTRLHLWGNVGQQIGDSGYSDSQAMFGVKVLF
ncbi:autotransporter outer membrane beta-barrel domain-containing protein [Citrobacter freundii]|uniref:autotransporter outer membrane beta-barrel domain-containing protein n=1 Tax=Citrobacter freundii TaxID=546 RepID=UPI002433FD7F|nr:autotransporter outer membrane beta-barrel domain-containing protein [Citrobacter freundii]WFW62450.1 autotransporter outer membrane beta-barrel domain-containing protein [Citrobacter freundii]